MKRHIIKFLFLGLSLVFLSSCFKQYLDRAPEAGLTDEEVFSKYENYVQFFNAVYDGRKYFTDGWYDYSIKNGFPMYFDMWDQKYTWEGLTDAADGGRYMEGHTLKAGSVAGFVNKFTYDGKRRPILESMFTCIRICNKSLENIPLLAANYTDTIEINDLKGQAYFVRAFCHFELFRIWGPMPYLTNTLDEGDQFDRARLSKHETLIKISQDFDTAAMYFARANKMRRDPLPGQTGHLADARQVRPTGVAAKAYKSRALLYAASPLNNELGIVDWQNAAKASWEALRLAEDTYKYAILTPLSSRKDLYYGKTYTNEVLWGYTWGSQGWNWGNWQGIISGVFGASTASWSGVCPTQNWVDKYETIDGMALNTPADRAAAIAAGKYVEQNPYTKRDPRLDADVIVNQGAAQGWTSGKAQIYYSVNANGSISYSELLDRNYLGRSFTGYYERKRWANQSQKNQNSYTISTPLFRLTELYLNFAEASNEAYGPATLMPGANLTAVQAINVVRTRAGMPGVLAAYRGSTDAFRPRIRNERNVELSFEGHYFFDIRRWKDAPVAYSSTIMGMDIEKLGTGYNATTYPTGFRYTRLALPKERQASWKDAMYYLPFNIEDNFKMKNFVPNEVW
jgi:hypothetical protein